MKARKCSTRAKRFHLKRIMYIVSVERESVSRNVQGEYHPKHVKMCSVTL